MFLKFTVTLIVDDMYLNKIECLPLWAKSSTAYNNCELEKESAHILSESIVQEVAQCPSGADDLLIKDSYSKGKWNYFIILKLILNWPLISLTNTY